MTGYGKATGAFEGKTITIEIKSLNSKFFELNLRLPSAYKDKEMELRSSLLKEADRGKMDVTISIEAEPGLQKNLLNKELIKAYLKDLSEVSAEFNLEANNLLEIIMQFPQVVNLDKAEPNEKEWEKVMEVLKEALKNFNLFRTREGKVLENDLKKRIEEILSLLEQTESFENERLVTIKTRLIAALKTLEANMEVDKNRFEQELIYYLEKLDITEEKVRLKTHCNYFLSLLNDGGNNGKKLGFIMQEIGREVNTIGSKANDAELQRKVVEMKDEAEKVKEQLSNIL